MKKINKFLKEYNKLIIFALACMFFFVLVYFLFNKDIIKLDSFIYDYIPEHFLSDGLTSFMKVITLFGGSYLLIGITVGFMFLVKDKKLAFFTSFNLILVAAISHILKFIIGRPRPLGYGLIEETGFSFPSSHSMISVAFYGFLIYLAYKNIKSKGLKFSLISTSSLIILLIGISRIYLGVHYTSDVFGGILLGLSYLIIYINVFRRVDFK